MKLHDLRPAPGSHKKKTRVGRGIAAGKGKTAGRGTKGQKARAGGTIPAWFEGGQTPLHQRIPKLRGFKNPFKIEYEVVNVGAIAGLVELGVLESGEMPGSKKAKGAAPAPITVNQEILRAAGLVRSLDKPMKILGNGELSTALFVVADRISASARAKIEAAGGTVSLLEVPTRPVPAIGVADAEPEADASPRPTRSPSRARARRRRRDRARCGGRAQAQAEDRQGRASPSRRPRPGLTRRHPRSAAPRPKAKAKPQRRPRSPIRPKPAAPSTDDAADDPRTPDRCSNRILNAFRAPDIRRRILFVLGILVVYRLLAQVPLPGVDRDAAREVLREQPGVRDPRPVRRWRPVPAVDRRPDDEPVHQRLDHHAADARA